MPQLAILASVNSWHCGQRHTYAASSGYAVWPHFPQMYLPSTWATMAKDSAP